MSEYVDFHYMPLEGKITGKQVLKQTEDAINDIGEKVYSLNIDSSLIDEAIETSETAMNIAESALSAVTTGRSIWFNNVAEMVEFASEVGVVAETKGYYLINDGGGAVYIIRQKTGGDVVDGGAIIQLDDETMVAQLVTDGEVNVKQFGAKGNGVDDDSTAFQNTSTYAQTNGFTAFVALGTYNVTETITGTFNSFGEVTIVGDGTVDIVNLHDVVDDVTAIKEEVENDTTSAQASATSAATSATNAANSATSAGTTLSQLIAYLDTKEEITAPIVDPTLTISGAAADATITGEIKSSTLVKTVRVGWEVGTFSSSNGSTSNNNARLRYIARTSAKDYPLVTALPGYEFSVFAADSSNAYVGKLDSDGTFKKSDTGYWIQSLSLRDFDGYQLMFVLRNKDNPSTTMTVSEGSNFIFWSETDKSLSASGVSADAKAVGDKADEITNKMTLVEPLNKWNENHVSNGYLGLNGSFNSSSSYEHCTDYIPVAENDVVRAYRVQAAYTDFASLTMRFITAYDSTKAALPAKGAEGSLSYTVPAGVAYVRISRAKNTNHPMITVNSVSSGYSAWFAPYYMADNGFNDIDIDTETNFDNIYLNWDNVNRLNPDDCQIGKYIGYNGVVYNNSSYFMSGHIAIRPGETLYIYSNRIGQVSRTFRYYSIYDQDGNHIGGGENVSSIAYVSGAKYVIISTAYRSDNTAFQPAGTMVTTNSAPTKFIAYGSTNPQFKAMFVPEIPESVPLVYLPSEICVGVGRTIELYNELVCRNASKYHLHYTCNVGTQYERKYTIVGVQNKIGSYGLTLDVYDDNMIRVWTGTSTVKVVENNIANTLNVLPIGDSLTNRKPWLLEVQNLSNSKIHFIGTRGLSTDPFHQEGRSGFTASDYNSNKSYTYDNNYVGNPNFSASANPFWDALNSKFSLSYWITNQAGTVGTPDVVQFFLGTNGLAIDPTPTVNAIVAMVDSVQDEYPNMPIFVCNTIYHSNQNGYYSSGGDGYVGSVGDWAYNNDLKTMNLQLALVEALSGYSNVYFAPLSVCMDRENDFGQVEVPVNPRLTTVTTTIPVEYTHPQNAGYWQIADVLYSCYCAHLS